MSIFGDIKTNFDLEEAAKLHLQTWEETYLAEVERQNDLEPRDLARLRSWFTSNEFRHWPEDGLPGMVLICPGLHDRPKREGNGRIRAKWQLGVGIVVSAKDQETSRRVASLYSAAFRAAMVQHPSLGGYAADVEWRDERYSDVPTERERTLAAAQMMFVVEVEEILDRRAGPTEPLEDPYDEPADWPQIEEVDVSVEPALEEA